MKHFIQLTFLTIILAGSTNFYSYAQTSEDSVSMGASYANDIYYSFEIGEVASAPRANWDIAFYTSPDIIFHILLRSWRYGTEDLPVMGQQPGY